MLSDVSPQRCKQKEPDKYDGEKVTTDHLEVRKMLHSVKQSFYWPGYREDIRRWCRLCRECNMITPTVESMEHGVPPKELRAYCRENVSSWSRQLKAMMLGRRKSDAGAGDARIYPDWMKI